MSRLRHTVNRAGSTSKSVKLLSMLNNLIFTALFQSKRNLKLACETSLRKLKGEKMKEKIIIGGLILLAFAGIALIQDHRNRRMKEYAKVNNCTWHATGSMYGDDRDFICIKKEAK